MPKVILILPEGASASQSEHEFEVAPVIGSIIELRLGGEKQFFRVDEAWHSDGADGRVGISPHSPTKTHQSGGRRQEPRW